MVNEVGHIMGYQKNICSIIPSEHLVSSDLVGVEIEAEGDARILLGTEFKYWNTHEEGSIRDGLELVFKQPLGGVDIVNALNELSDFIDNHGIHINYSYRTSLHVHIDVRDISTRDLKDLCLLYIILERILFKVCGEKRYNNTFCSSSELDDRLIHYLPYLDTDLPYSIDNLSANRYLSINLAAVARFGSVEFRGHEGTHDKDRLLLWINILLSLKKFVVDNDFDFSDISFNVSSNGPEEFLKSVFGDIYKALQSPDNRQDLILGIRRAQDVENHEVFRELKQHQDEAEVELNLSNGKNVSPIFNQFRKSRSNRTPQNREGAMDSVNDQEQDIDVRVFEINPEP